MVRICCWLTRIAIGAAAFDGTPGAGGRADLPMLERSGTYIWDRQAISSQALSPRARGNGWLSPISPKFTGSIPANAGERYQCLLRQDHSKVYPRERGETMQVQVTLNPQMGLSPRARGNGWPDAHGCVKRARPPARRSAGNGRGVLSYEWPIPPPSRERGGTVVRRGASIVGVGLSPRARGNIPEEATIGRDG